MSQGYVVATGDRMGLGYAVIDLETTGLFPGRHDRVIEVGVVQTDPDGVVTGSYSTLVNPGRDLGPADIHGILAEDVRHAPSFADVAGDLLHMLAGRIVAAHNLRFDALFLRAECARIGLDIRWEAPEGLCTMTLANCYLNTASRSLSACCATAGITTGHAHAALADAQAAAGLLRHYLGICSRPVPWRGLPDFPPASVQPRHTCPIERGSAAAVRGRSGHFLGRLSARLPSTGNPHLDPYLAVLDDVLIDRQVSDTEADALVELAGDLGLSRDDVLEAHRLYVTALARTAWEDGVVTGAEHAELTLVSRLLAVPDEHLARIVVRPDPGTTPVGRPLGRFALSPGDRVVFTGAMDCDRSVWEERATAAGLDVGSKTVTKRTRVVIAADPDSLSGKARKAHDYGIPVITEEAFESLLGAMEPSPVGAAQ